MKNTAQGINSLNFVITLYSDYSDYIQAEHFVVNMMVGDHYVIYVKPIQYCMSMILQNGGENKNKYFYHTDNTFS